MGGKAGPYTSATIKTTDANAGSTGRKMTCPECGCESDKIFTLLRAPEHLVEARACPKCRPQFEKVQGMVVAGSRKQHGKTVEGALTCGGCGEHSNDTVIMSHSGKPTDAKACADCAEILKARGWRATTVIGKA